MNYPAQFIIYYQELNIKLTALRKEVLYILWQQVKSIKAYDILAKLLQTKSNATPPSVYRALDFFVEQGIIHKIDSLNAYTLCQKPIEKSEAEILFICSECHNVVEVFNYNFHILIDKFAKSHAFTVKNHPIEIMGSCQICLEGS